LLGLRIPEELSILSVDNDEFECLFTTPTLSSIDIPAFKIGLAAAGHLENMIAGTNPPPPPVTLLPPVQVVQRQSTDVVATADSAVRTGISYIRAHYAEQISVDDVADAADCSRRTLERRFRAALDRTVHEELARQRLARARRLLIETDLDLETLAHRSGFTDARRLAVVFRQHFGRSPSNFRSQLR
jgi:LacI family transcriptional regulator